MGGRKLRSNGINHVLIGVGGLESKVFVGSLVRIRVHVFLIIVHVYVFNH